MLLTRRKNSQKFYAKRKSEKFLLKNSVKKISTETGAKGVPENNPYGILQSKEFKANKKYFQSNKNLKLISFDHKNRKKLSKGVSKKKLTGEKPFTVSRKASRKRLLSNQLESNKNAGFAGDSGNKQEPQLNLSRVKLFE